jgi:predicted phosphodiesterase
VGRRTFYHERLLPPASLARVDHSSAVGTGSTIPSGSKFRLKVATVSKKPELYVVLSDIHYPVHSKRAIKAVFEFIRRNPVAGLVLLGDFLDFETISHHTAHKPRLRRRGGYQHDIDGFKRDVLNPLEKLLPRDTKRICVFGNHERFLDDFIDEHPALEGAISVEKSLELVKRGWKVIPVGGHYKINNVLLMHGDQIGSSAHVAKKLVETTCRNSLMGHVHRFSAFTKTGVEDGDKWCGQTLPCLSTTSPKYAKGRPNSFLHGFGIIESWGHHRVNVYIPIITGGKFCFHGTVYGG